MRTQLFLIEHGTQIEPPAFNKMLREVAIPNFFLRVGVMVQVYTTVLDNFFLLC